MRPRGAAISLTTDPTTTRRRIATAISKIGLAVRHAAWTAVLPYGLTPTQGEILAILRRIPAGVRPSALAAELGITRATVTDALAALARKGLVRLAALPQDRRGRLVRVTRDGARAAVRAVTWPDILRDAARALSVEEQGVLLRILLKLIRELQERGRIVPARMCVSCQFFRPYTHADPARPHHCAFVDAAFGDPDLRIECPDHVAAAPRHAAQIWKAFNRRAG
jgi:DNA-binding MarR family transcriptional regulator